MAEKIELEAMLAEIKSLTAEIDASAADLRAQREAELKDNAEAEEELAAKRRNGELGRDWQVLQQRIDMNRTTMEDILSGVDKSDEARAIRKLLEDDVVPRMRQEFAAGLESDSIAEDLERLQQAQQEFAQTLARTQLPGQGAGGANPSAPGPA